MTVFSAPRLIVPAIPSARTEHEGSSPQVFEFPSGLLKDSERRAQILSPDLQHAWNTLKISGIDVAQDAPLTRKLLETIREAASAGQLANDPGRTFVDVVPLLRITVEHKDFSKEALSTIRTVLASTSDETVATCCVRLLAFGLQSPYACKTAIRAFSHALAGGNTFAWDFAFRELEQMLGSAKSDGDFPSHKQIIAGHILLGAIELPPTTAHAPLAQLAFERRALFAKHECTGWDPPAELLARDKMEEMAPIARHPVDELGYDCISYATNPFDTCLVEAMRYLDPDGQDEVKKCFRARAGGERYHFFDSSIRSPHFAAEGAAVTLDLSGFGTEAFSQDFKNQAGVFYPFLFPKGAAVLAARMETAPLSQNIEMFQMLCEEFSSGWRFRQACIPLTQLYSRLSELIETEPNESNREQFNLSITTSLKEYFAMQRPQEGKSDEQRLKLSKQARACLDAFAEFLVDFRPETPPGSTDHKDAAIQELIHELGCAVRGEYRKAMPTPSRQVFPARTQPATPLSEDPPPAPVKSAKALKLDEFRGLLNSFIAAPDRFFGQFENFGGVAQEAFDLYGSPNALVKDSPELSEFLRDVGLPLGVSIPLEGGKSGELPIIEAWRYGNSSIGAGWLLAAQMESIAKLEGVQAGTVRKLYDHYGLIHFARYSPDALIEQALTPPSKFSPIKPIHLFFSRSDHNGAFFQSSAIAKLHSTASAPVIIHEFSSPASLARRLLWARDRFGYVNNIGILGHGGLGSISAPTYLRAQHIWTVETGKLLARVVGTPAHIFFGSCFSGDHNGLVDTLAMRLKGREFTIVGSEDSHSTLGIEFDSKRGFTLDSSKPVTRYVGSENGKLLRTSRQVRNHEQRVTVSSVPTSSRFS